MSLGAGLAGIGAGCSAGGVAGGKAWVRRFAFLGQVAMLALLVLPGVATAQAAEPLPPAELARQRQALADQRAAIDQAFTAEKAQCAQRFAVTACENNAAQKRRNALAPLRQEELVLKQADHQRRGEEQLERLANKTLDKQSPARQQERQQSSAQHTQRLERVTEQTQIQRTPADERQAAQAAQNRVNKQLEKAQSRQDLASQADSRRAARERRVSEAQAHKAQKLRELQDTASTARKPLPLSP